MKFKCAGIVCLSVILVNFMACDKDDDDDNNNRLSGADRTFIIQASYANNNEIGAGAVANVKGSDTAVRAYGAMMVSEHTTAQNDLKDLADDWNIQVPGTPDPMHVSMIQQIMQLSGQAFDTTYMRSQIMDHTVAMNLFQQQVDFGQNRRLKDYANKYLHHIHMHKDRADNIMMRLQ
jgi:putative membrane protein